MVINLTTMDGYLCGLFFHALTYSTKYLLFTISVSVISILWVWIYEKPRLYKLIFKKSKHSTLLTPEVSDVNMEGDTITPALDPDDSHANMNKAVDSCKSLEFVKPAEETKGKEIKTSY